MRQHRAVFHAPEPETECSGSILLLQGLDRAATIACFVCEQACGSGPSVSWRGPCILDQAGWWHLHPDGTPVRVRVAAFTDNPVADNLFLNFRRVGGAGLGQRFRPDVRHHRIDRPLVPKQIEEGWFRFPVGG